MGAHRAGFATGSAECGFRTAEEKAWSQCPPRFVQGFVVAALLCDVGKCMNFIGFRSVAILLVHCIGLAATLLSLLVLIP